jgi:diaminopimelate epimerase
MQFTKMQGAGNDYIYVNVFNERVEDPVSLAKAISDRHFGAGADGLVLIGPSENADFFMDMYNADGSRGKMCGNAIRCVAKYCADRAMFTGNDVRIETLSGVKLIKVYREDGKVTKATVNMGSPVLDPKLIPADIPGDTAVNADLCVCGVTYPVTCISMGNPHCVILASGVAALPLDKIGPCFEHCDTFPEGVNTEFAEPVSPSLINMRVWERGSGETLACGTGACATAVACILSGYCKKDSDITVHLLGGDLSIRWDSYDNNVYLTGPAVSVYDGQWPDERK